MLPTLWFQVSPTSVLDPKPMRVLEPCLPQLAVAGIPTNLEEAEGLPSQEWVVVERI